MQFAKYFALAMAVAMPALALPTVENRAVGNIEIAGRSYLIVAAAEGEETEISKRSYLIVAAAEADEESEVQRRAVEGDKVISEDGSVYILVPEKK